MLDVNEIKIRLYGIANTDTEPKLSKEYDLTISNAEIAKSEDIPNDDGTINRIYKLVITERSEINLIAENEVIKCQKKGSQSQKQRNILVKLADKYGEDREEYYNKRMSKNIESLLNELNI